MKIKPEYVGIDGRIYKIMPKKFRVKEGGNPPRAEIIHDKPCTQQYEIRKRGRQPYSLFTYYYNGSIQSVYGITSITDLIDRYEDVITGDTFVLETNGGSFINMHIDKTYGYLDCMSSDLIGPTKALKSDSTNTGAFRNHIISKYLTWYYNNKFPPSLRNYIIDKIITAPYKCAVTGIRHDMNHYNMGPLWIPYVNEVLPGNFVTYNLRQYKLYEDNCVKTAGNYIGGNDPCKEWWTASPDPDSKDGFVAISADGSTSVVRRGDTTILGIPLCFRLFRFTESLVKEMDKK